MATTTENSRNPEAPATAVEQFALHVKENAGMYIASTVIVIVVFAGTALFRLRSDMNAAEDGGAYAAALNMEDSVERVAALGAIADSGSRHSKEALYLEGFTSLEIADYDSAEAAFTELRSKHPDFEFTPDAVEGLGLIKKEQGDYAGAIAVFEEVMSTWPDSFAARRQPYNIAQCHEKSGNLEAAVKAFQDQLAQFPDSNVALRADTELNRLRAQHPELDTTSELTTIDELSIQ